MRAQIERMAEQGRPDVFALVERGEAIVWPKAAADVQVFQFGTEPVSKPTVTVPNAGARRRRPRAARGRTHGGHPRSRA
jgi:hypothetical protein